MTAAAIAPTPAPASVPFAPASLKPWQARQIIHSGELATAKGLRLIGRGTCRVAGHIGAPVFIVSSASGGHSHIVWIGGGRIHCDCLARTARRAFTCSHAQFVRLLIVAERATPASVPPAAIESTPEPEPPAPEPSPARRVACPTCGGPTDPAEVEQLGECLNCLQMRADMERTEVARVDAIAEESAAQLPCWACGAAATAETDHGLYCDQCVKMSPPALALTVQARQKFIAAGRITGEPAAKTIRRAPKEETARRIIAREQTRERAGTPSAASPRAARATRRSSQPAD